MTRQEREFIKQVLNYQPGKHQICKDAFAYDRVVEWYRTHLRLLLQGLKNSL